MAALIVAGLIAGLTAVAYWRVVAQRTAAARDGHVGGGADGRVVWDEERAAAELGEAQERFNEIASQKLSSEGVAADVKRLVEQYPQYAAAKTLWGQLLIYQGQFEAAYEQFKAGLELDGRQPEVHLLAGTLASGLGRLDQATQHYSMAVGLAPSNPRYRLHLAQAYLAGRKEAEAKGLILEAIKIDSSLHEGYAMLADLYAKQNKTSLALPQLQNAIENVPAGGRAKQVVYIRRKAQLLRRENRAQEAILTLGGLSPEEQRDNGVLEEIAVCWSMLGKFDEAAGVYERAAAEQPMRWEWVLQAARWRVKGGDHEAAREHLARVREINPRAPGVEELEKELR